MPDPSPAEQRAQILVREHWKQIGCDPDTMASFEDLGTVEKRGFVEKAERELESEKSS